MNSCLCSSKNIWYFLAFSYPFHLVSDFGTEFNLEPKIAFVNEIITIKKPFSVPKWIRFQNHWHDEMGITWLLFQVTGGDGGLSSCCTGGRPRTALSGVGITTSAPLKPQRQSETNNSIPSGRDQGGILIYNNWQGKRLESRMGPLGPSRKISKAENAHSAIWRHSFR